MSLKRIVPRERANRDIAEAVDHHSTVAGAKAALGFIDALERANRDIARHPASGSSRYAHELNLPGLRAWPLKRHPYLIFFIERDDHIDVWCILHAAA